METISRLPRRLTQLYSDTKESCDAVIEQDTPETQPEVNALHRKYRIQKDRLIAWGLQWSDNTKGKGDDIDESVERAGLTETVTSVLGTIKDILDEAERMHPPSAQTSMKTLSGEKGGVVGRPSDVASWAASDRSRYEDLATDLTTSIDILYDLSRSRRAYREGSRGPSPSSKVAPLPQRPSTSASVFLSSEYNASDLTLINPTTFPAFPSVTEPSPSRSDLPPRLLPSDLILPQEEPPPYESVGGSSSIRVIGKLRSRHSSTNPWKTDGNRSIETPVLIEYAAFDPTYRTTGVSPPLDRLETLLSNLSRLAEEQSFHGTLKCLGYFEDSAQPRYGLVFELPSFVYSGGADAHKPLEEFRPVTLLSVLQTGSKSQHNSNSATPPLEDRFRLAFTLALTFNKLHGDNFAHKDVNSSNILVFSKNRRQSHNSKALQYALRSPVICSFDLFSEYNIDTNTTPQPLNIYRHPQDPKFTGEKGKEHGPQFDLYSLGLILLEIGLWVPLSDLWKPKYTLADFKQRVEDVYIRRLASKCGTAYMQAVRDCFWAADRIASGAESMENFSQLYNRIRIRLQRCCLLDEVDPRLEFGETKSDAHGFGSPPLKRKNMNPVQSADPPPSPSHRSAKRWALEKSTEVLGRTRSLSKTTSPRSSPNPSSLSRHGSQRSQSSIRKSISHFISPKEEAPEPMDWRHTQSKLSLDESTTLTDPSTDATTRPTTVGSSTSLPLQKSESRASITTAQRSWRPSISDPSAKSGSTISTRDYKEKITIIQKAWRRRKAKRSNTIETLLTVATPPAALGYTPQTQRLQAYPTPEPEVQPINCDPQPDFGITSIQLQKSMASPTRPKLRLHPIEFNADILNEWHNVMLPRLERLIERALKDSDETISIDLVAIGKTASEARPTIFVTCSSDAKVRSILKQRFTYDKVTYDLKVRRGKVRRSKMNRSSHRVKPAHRSMMNTEEYTVVNPYYQQRPVCGASIGAFRDEHLPPVSYGGVILVDDEPMGMTVHHLLDAPSDDESDSDDEAVSPGPNDAVLSSAAGSRNPWLMGMGSQPGVQLDSNATPAWHLELTDDEDEEKIDDDNESFSFSDSQYASEDDSDSYSIAESIASDATTGDIEGICAGDGDEIKITQPAIDDIEDDFFPNEDDRDDDHLSSHELGYVHASSGIRRWKRDGILHEIDWALLKINEDRLQPYNLVQGGRGFSINPDFEPDQRLIQTKLQQPVERRHYSADEDEYPNGVADADSLGGLNVHCFGRTTGLQGGMVGHAMSSVRIYRRKTFSRSWHVAGKFGGKSNIHHTLSYNYCSLTLTNSRRRFRRLGYPKRNSPSHRPRPRLVRSQPHRLHLPDGSPLRRYPSHPRR